MSFSERITWQDGDFEVSDKNAEQWRKENAELIETWDEDESESEKKDKQ